MIKWLRRRWRTVRKYFRLSISSVELPWGLGKIDFAPNDEERVAAWNLYIELTTRISTQRLDPEAGMLREALASLNSLFGFTRKTLSQCGPDVAYDLGPVALSILNKGIRPFTAKWHPLLKSWEFHKPEDVSDLEHEQQWPHNAQMRAELVQLQDALREYARALGKIAGVDSELHERLVKDEHKNA
ncbi:MAG: hypothetical protein SF162_16525 [bacterium]|nr:hypothetical protein [bacterium]